VDIDQLNQPSLALRKKLLISICSHNKEGRMPVSKRRTKILPNPGTKIYST
jgi:hypothetical protein